MACQGVAGRGMARQGAQTIEAGTHVRVPASDFNRRDYSMSNIVKADILDNELGNLQNEQDVLNMLAKLEMVKDALKAADQFREQSIKFARYEAYALISAVEISGDTSLIKGKYRKLAAGWLVTLNDEERAEFIAKCDNGKTIDNVYREQVFLPEQRSALGEAVNDCKKKARDELKKSGTVNVPDIVRGQSHKFPKSMLKEITDGVRGAVRDAGGVGIGGNSGIYIDPDKKSNYIADAIKTRVEAVSRDIEGIADLAKRCESKPVFHIKGNGSQISFMDVTYMILSGIGCADVYFDSSSAKKQSVSILRQIAGDV